jgi:hypothetical protein
VIQGELRQFVRKRFNVGSNPITCIAASQFSSRIVAVGNHAGYVRIIDLKYGDDSDLFDQEEGVEYEPIPESTEYKTLFRSRLFPTSVEKILFDPTGKYLLCVAGNGKVFVLEVHSEFKILGSVDYSGEFQSATWNYEGVEQENVVCRSFLLQDSTLLYHDDKGSVWVFLYSQVCYASYWAGNPHDRRRILAAFKIVNLGIRSYNLTLDFYISHRVLLD